MLLGLAYQLMRFITDLVLVRTRSDAELRAGAARDVRAAVNEGGLRIMSKLLPFSAVGALW